MKHNMREEDKALVVAFDGDIDLECSPDVRKVLLGCVEKGKPVMVDLQQVTYIDSSGVASLVEALQTARKNKVDFSLANASDAALRVLKLARLDKVFTIHESIDAGLASL